jgi:hypothetical protein
MKYIYFMFTFFKQVMKNSLLQKDIENEQSKFLGHCNFFIKFIFALIISHVRMIELVLN